MINGSFVFGLDDDDKDVFKRTVDWAVEQGINNKHFSYTHTISRHKIIPGDGSR